MSDLNGPGSAEGSPPTMGGMQITGVALQSGMTIEKMLLSLVSVLPGFQSTAQQIIPLLRSGLLQAMKMGEQPQGPPPSSPQMQPIASPAMMANG